ncbi:MAG: hypothetical protein KBT11_04510 [Treponema sp.]|nr:hypothetical protein [Candidatus Treponema equifaecale]
MTTEKVNDLELVSVADYFDPKHFRIIPAELAGIMGGISEVPVTFNIHYKFSNKVIFNLTKLQNLFGFGIMNAKLKEINGYDYYGVKGKSKLKRVYFNDSGELTIMVFEFFEEKEKLFAVKSDEVLDLINNCRFPIPEV